MTNANAGGAEPQATRHAWEPMTLVHLGSVSDVMHAGTGIGKDVAEGACSNGANKKPC